VELLLSCLAQGWCLQVLVGLTMKLVCYRLSWTSWSPGWDGLQGETSMSMELWRMINRVPLHLRCCLELVAQFSPLWTCPQPEPRLHTSPALPWSAGVQ
jgi:hypothetical protein